MSETQKLKQPFSAEEAGLNNSLSNSKEYYKKNAERQNFKISQNIGKSAETNIWNKEVGKNYGANGVGNITSVNGRYKSSQFDFDQLRKSNVPFGFNSTPNKLPTASGATNFNATSNSSGGF